MSVSEARISQILREYDEARTAAQARAHDRQQQIYRQFPRIRLIDQQLESLGLRAVQSYLRFGKDKEQVLAQLKTDNQLLLAEKESILRQAGYPSDYLEIHYRCPVCQDTGYANGQKCRCLQQRLIDLAYDRSNIKSVLQRENFNTFNPACFSAEPVPGEPCSPRENIQRIRGRILTYVSHFPKEAPPHLFFYGNTGTGKTFLCNCIAKALLDQGYTVLYLTSYELCNAFESYRFRDKSKTTSPEGSIQELIRDIDLLIIDDLGTEFSTALSVSDLFYCINQRILLQKPVILSTNLNLGQVARVYTDRMASRISGNFQLFKFYGPDLRIPH